MVGEQPVLQFDEYMRGKRKIDQISPGVFASFLKIVNVSGSDHTQATGSETDFRAIDEVIDLGVQRQKDFGKIVGMGCSGKSIGEYQMPAGIVANKFKPEIFFHAYHNSI
jgi:hypothetical protein